MADLFDKAKQYAKKHFPLGEANINHANFVIKRGGANVLVYQYYDRGYDNKETLVIKISPKKTTVSRGGFGATRTTVKSFAEFKKFVDALR